MRVAVLIIAVAVIAVVTIVGVAAAQQSQRAEWNAPQAPFRIHGNTYYVGTRGLSVVLVTSGNGHVLLDGALPESVPAIVSNIRSLGFRVEDIRFIVNSHIHFDHAGGIGQLQQLSGAKVAATRPAARVLESGRSGPDDPQFGVLDPIDPVKQVQVVSDRETIRVGGVAITAHATGGHTPGGTSWTWRSCEEGRCVDVVYADSLTAVSADGFRYTSSREYPNALRDFEKSFATLSALPCDILLTPHPDASALWSRVKARDETGDPAALIDPTACRRYVEGARTRLNARVALEQKQP